MRSNTRLQVLACSTTMMAQLGVTLYLPATPSIVESLNMSEAEGYTSLLMYLGGGAIPLIFASRTINCFGRSAVLLGFCCALFSGSVLSMWASDSDVLYFSRMMQGVGGGGAALIGRALLAEIYSGVDLARSLSLLSYAFVFALIVGQVVGGYLVSFFSWKALSLTMAFGSVLIVSLLLPVRKVLCLFDARGRRRVSGFVFANIIVQRSFYLPVVVGGCGYGVFVIHQGVGAYVFNLLLGWESSDYGLFGVGLGLAYFLGALSVRLALRSMSTFSLSVLTISVMVAAVSIFLLATLGYVGRHAAVMAYLAIWYAQAVTYPCVASMAVQKFSGMEAMMLFSFFQQMLALLLGTVAAAFIPLGLSSVALLTLGLSSAGVIVTMCLSIKRT
ncbi:MFS transporter [Pseudomonas sp. W4I3]|uniref:MFS transporter n=1 Tax=Pseudomonas sp. W4I3 TaxID=3042294 RepID=UPI00277E3E18|nr:MFS transporter [Pseudomonas sp. W4I3]MDQ0740061.1 DHA1 family bicyclomycin/chloramphenicol resistance-like MFS transporter [Pseudomonas sp. W4I3]